jgi:hypothetical protein
LQALHPNANAPGDWPSSTVRKVRSTRAYGEWLKRCAKFAWRGIVARSSSLPGLACRRAQECLASAPTLTSQREPSLASTC